MDFEKVGAGVAKFIKGTGENLTNLGKEWGDAVVDAFNTTTKGEIKKIKVDADTEPAEETVEEFTNSGTGSSSKKTTVTKQTYTDDNQRNIYLWKNPSPSYSQAVKTCVYSCRQYFWHIYRSVLNVPVWQFQLENHRQLGKGGQAQPVLFEQRDQGTGLYTA